MEIFSTNHCWISCWACQKKWRRKSSFLNYVSTYSLIYGTCDPFRTYPETKSDQTPFRTSSDSLYGKPDTDIWEEGIVKGITSGRFQIRGSDFITHTVLVIRNDLYSKFSIMLTYFKLGCVVRMVVDSILPHTKSGPNDIGKMRPRLLTLIGKSRKTHPEIYLKF